MNSKKRRKRRAARQISIIKKLFDIGIFLLTVLLITYFLNNYVIERCKVHNHSMEPTLTEGNVLLIDKISYRYKSPKRYDIVTLINTKDNEELIKRIIGLPGETVRIVQGRIFIDGNVIKDIDGLDAPFDAGIAEYDFELGDNEYFVLGDNRKVSIDSRSEDVGAVTLDSIKGKAFIRIKPLSKFIIK